VLRRAKVGANLRKVLRRVQRKVVRRAKVGARARKVVSLRVSIRKAVRKVRKAEVVKKVRRVAKKAEVAKKVRRASLKASLRASLKASLKAGAEKIKLKRLKKVKKSVQVWRFLVIIKK
jgi:hypothetical protein